MEIESDSYEQALKTTLKAWMGDKSQRCNLTAVATVSAIAIVKKEKTYYVTFMFALT